MVCFFDFSGIMPAVYGMYLNPIKHRNKCHISIRKPDFRVTLREISGITTDFRDFPSLQNEYNEWMVFFLCGQIYCRNYGLSWPNFLTVRTRYFRWNHQNLKCSFLSKVIIRKTAEICRNYYDAENRIVSNYQIYRFQILIAQNKDLNKYGVTILRPQC